MRCHSSEHPHSGQRWSLDAVPMKAGSMLTMCSRAKRWRQIPAEMPAVVARVRSPLLPRAAAIFAPGSARRSAVEVRRTGASKLRARLNLMLHACPHARVLLLCLPIEANIIVGGIATRELALEAAISVCCALVRAVGVLQHPRQRGRHECRGPTALHVRCQPSLTTH
jgi:hypothetical protein